MSEFDIPDFQAITAEAEKQRRDRPVETLIADKSLGAFEILQLSRQGATAELSKRGLSNREIEKVGAFLHKLGT